MKPRRLLPGVGINILKILKILNCSVRVTVVYLLAPSRHVGRDRTVTS